MNQSSIMMKAVIRNQNPLLWFSWDHFYRPYGDHELCMACRQWHRRQTSAQHGRAQVGKWDLCSWQTMQQSYQLSKIMVRNFPGSHYLLTLKFKDFSTTFRDPQVSFSTANSRRKFTAWAVEPQYLMFIYVMMVQLLRNKTWYYLATVISRSRVQILLEATLRNNLRHVVYTYVPLSPSSITWYRPKGGDALRLGR